jgi:hypothetical protein
MPFCGGIMAHHGDKGAIGAMITLKRLDQDYFESLDL